MMPPATGPNSLQIAAVAPRDEKCASYLELMTEFR